MQWEKIGEEEKSSIGSVASDRLKIPGGWIVRTVTFRFGTGGGTFVAQTFVEDKEHAWKLE